MKKSNKQPMVTGQNLASSTPLQRAVEKLYQVFGTRRLPDECLDVCTACCMDPAMERDMRRLPLRQLTQQHFYEYNGSAKSLVQPTAEIKYFLPRMLELLAQGACLHHSIELYLDRVGRCEEGAFLAKEQAALAEFACAFFAEGLEQMPNAPQPLFQGESAFTIVLMWAYAGVELEPLLAHWLACDSEASTLHFVNACYWDHVYYGHRLNNAFSSQRPQYERSMTHWLQHPAHQALWAEKTMRLAELGPAQSWWPAGLNDHHLYPLPERINAVFDAMTP